MPLQFRKSFEAFLCACMPVYVDQIALVCIMPSERRPGSAASLGVKVKALLDWAEESNSLEFIATATLDLFRGRSLPAVNSSDRSKLIQSLPGTGHEYLRLIARITRMPSCMLAGESASTGEVFSDLFSWVESLTGCGLPLLKLAVQLVGEYQHEGL